MEIVVGKNAGFCYGVERAVNGAKEVLKKEKVFGLGEIVHNKDVVKDLENQGMKFIESIEQGKDKVIIRAHGVTKNVYEKAKKLNIELVDYTCPKVLKIHEIVEEYSKEGYYIFLLGSKKHPENIGTISYCDRKSCIIEKEDDIFKAIDSLEKLNVDKVLVLAQTTFSIEKFYIMEEIIRNELPKNIKLVIKNTICQATELRQQETLEMSKNVDCMIIIGGKNSSNSKKLYDIAKENCKIAIGIENEKDLNMEIIKSNYKIGIMAGASTPKESIEKVVEKIKELN